MDKSRKAKRSKSLSVEPIDDTRFRFELTLDDVSLSPAGDEVIHSLEITGEISVPDLEILSIEPRAIYHPYPQCSASLEPFRELVGARIGAGFRSRVLEAMGRTRGCTHFMALALDLGAAHTLTTFLRMRSRSPYASRNAPDGEWMRFGLEVEPKLENACVALQSSSPLIEAAKKRAAEHAKRQDN